MAFSILPYDVLGTDPEPIHPEPICLRLSRDPVSPLQGEPDPGRNPYSGRCPGLSSRAPSGQFSRGLRVSWTGKREDSDIGKIGNMHLTPFIPRARCDCRLRDGRSGDIKASKGIGIKKASNKGIGVRLSIFSLTLPVVVVRWVYSPQTDYDRSTRTGGPVKQNRLRVPCPVGDVRVDVARQLLPLAFRERAGEGAGEGRRFGKRKLAKGPLTLTLSRRERGTWISILQKLRLKLGRTTC